MLTISKVFSILCLLCLYGSREYPGSFQNKISKLFFQISAQLYSVPGQNEVEGRPPWIGQAKIYHLNYL